MPIIDTPISVVSSLQHLKGIGITAIGRYYSRYKWKVLSRNEAELIGTAGISIFVVYEDGASPNDFDGNKGVFDAQNALQCAKDVGQPTNSAIYFAVDFNSDADQVAQRIIPYFQAIRQVFGENKVAFAVGIYGNGLACQKLLDMKLCDYTWLSNSTSYNGTKEFYASKRWALAQRLPQMFGGLKADPNESNGDFGAFRLASATTRSSPDAASAERLFASSQDEERGEPRQHLSWSVETRGRNPMSMVQLTRPDGSPVAINPDEIVNLAPVPTNGPLMGPLTIGTRIVFRNQSHQDVTELLAVVVEKIDAARGGSIAAPPAPARANGHLATSLRILQHPTTGKQFKMGRRRPIARGPRFSLENYLMRDLLPPPISIDYWQSAGAPAFLTEILGNDTLGDCTAAGAFHIGGVLLAGAGSAIPYTTQNVIAFYSATTGYVPGDESTDQGGDEQTVLNYWQQTGLLPSQHRIAGWLGVNAADSIEVKTAVWLMENVYFGVELPDAWINPMPLGSGFVWDVAGDPDPNNGHCFVGLGYDAQGVQIDTWGMIGTVTWAAIAKYSSTAGSGELYTVVGPDGISKASGKAPNGFDWSQLVADFDSMGGRVSPPAPA
jgi:hypothetical protein